MNAPVIPAAAAQRLNRLVQSQVDPHLFLFCNYEPTRSYAISEDAQFLTAVQDLYKFAVDSSCILKCYYRYVLPADREPFKPLARIIDQIRALRAVIDHNQSDANGMMEQNLLRTCATWVRNVLGKPEPTTLQDFAALTARLTQMGNHLVRLTENWISYIGHKADADKARDAEEWTKRILRWYCSNSKTEIYTGQLMDAYLARTSAAGRSINIPNYQLQRKVNNWIRHAYLFPLSNAIEELETDIAGLGNMLQNSAVCTRLSAEQQQTLRRKAAEYRQQLAVKHQELADLQTKIGENPVEYFYRNLEAQLYHTISALAANPTDYTLLPQDLLQEDIQLFFANIPSPEGDF